MESSENRGVAVEQTVVVRDAEGADRYRLRTAEGQVAVELVGVQWSPAKVPLANLREAVNALHAMGTDDEGS
jgi:hypothetical protein